MALQDEEECAPGPSRGGHTARRPAGPLAAGDAPAPGGRGPRGFPLPGAWGRTPAMPAMSSSAAARRRVHAWCMYDWANSAYVTTVAVAVLPAYFAAAVVPEAGVSVLGARLSAASLWGYLVSATALVVFVLAPPLGAVADHLGLRRRLLLAFCLCGGLAATGLVAVGPGAVWLTAGLFFVAQVGFVGGNVFYDSLLGHVAPAGRLDAVSGRGFAYGYVGGGLQFALALGCIAGHRALGLDADLAARLAMSSAGLWWLGFGLWAVRGMDEPPGTAPRGAGLAAPAREALGRLRGLWGRARAVPGLVPFMLAFLFYNDGVQTTISMATIYGKTELGLSTTVLMVTLLVIQFVSVFGALAFSRLAGAVGTRAALMLAVALWAGVAVYAWSMRTATEYFVLGAVVGLVMGGSQALSRSLYARLIPADRPAEFFGYFSVVNRLSAIVGPAVFAAVAQHTGSARGGILVLTVFFILGLALLARVPAGRADAPGSQGA